MKDTKLILLLQSIRSRELPWLSKWVRSPYYNQHQQVAELFELLRKFHPRFHSSRLSKEQLYAQLLPGEAYDDLRMRQWMHKLTELVESFLVAQRLKNHPFTSQQLLREELGERNLYDLFEKKTETLRRKLDESPYRDEQHYLDQWRLQHDHFFHPQTKRLQVATSQLTSLMQQLDAFFLLSKLRYSTELRNRENILSESHDIFLLEEIRQLATTHPAFGSHQVFQIYLDVLGLMEEPRNETIYNRLETNLIANLDLFRVDDQSTMLRYLINSSIQLYQEGKKAYLPRQFNLYRLGLDKDLFLAEGKLPDSTYLNITITGTALGELDWVAEFIETYASKLTKTRRQDAQNLATAYLLFAQQQFSACAALLRQIESTDLRYQLRYKSLSFRSVFERFWEDDSYYELLVSESKSFEKFLRRDERLSERRIQAYLNLIIFLRKISKLRTSYQLTRQQINLLQDKIAAEPMLIAKDWLLEKLQGLSSGERS